MANLFKNWDSLSHLWQGGLVPYEIDPSVDDVEDAAGLVPREEIEKAIAHWEEETPARFVPKIDDDEHWTVFVLDPTAKNCNSGIGRKKRERGEGHRIEFKQEGCAAKSVVHEMGHRIGLVHEHQRLDRDNHIIIYPQLFPRLGEDGIKNNILNKAGEPYLNYDYRSVMHYTAFGGSFDPYTLSWRPGYVWCSILSQQ